MKCYFCIRKKKNADGSWTWYLRRVVDNRHETLTRLFRANYGTKRQRSHADGRANKAIVRARHEHEHHPTNRKSPYLHEAVEMYVAYSHGKDALRPPMSFQQAEAHERIIRKFCATVPRSTTLNKLQRGMFNRWFDSLMERHKRSTVRQYMSFLQAFLNYAYQSEWMQRPVKCTCKEHTNALKTLPQDRFISDESLAQAFALEDFGLLCRVLASTGLRVGELQQLTCASFSTVDLTIRVESVHEERTKRHARVIPIHQELADELREFTDGRMHYDALFSFAQTTLRDKLREFGLKPHSMRRWFNSELVAALTPDLFRKKLMGHALGARDGAYLVNFDPEQVAPFTDKVHERIKAISTSKGNGHEE